MAQLSDTARNAILAAVPGVGRDLIAILEAMPSVTATAAPAALTDNSAGTANSTIQALADGTTYATDVAAIRNNFADIVAKINELRTALIASGVLTA